MNEEERNRNFDKQRKKSLIQSKWTYREIWNEKKSREKNIGNSNLLRRIQNVWMVDESCVRQRSKVKAFQVFAAMKTEPDDEFRVKISSPLGFPKIFWESV